MENFLNALGSVVWGAPMLCIFIFTALRFSLKSKFFQLRGITTILKETIFKMFSKTENKEKKYAYINICRHSQDVKDTTRQP